MYRGVCEKIDTAIISCCFQRSGYITIGVALGPILQVVGLIAHHGQVLGPRVYLAQL